MQPLFHEARNLKVVGVRKGRVGVAPNPHIRKDKQGGVPAAAVDGVHKGAGPGLGYAPHLNVKDVWFR